MRDPVSDPHQVSSRRYCSAPVGNALKVSSKSFFLSFSASELYYKRVAFRTVHARSVARVRFRLIKHSCRDAPEDILQIVSGPRTYRPLIDCLSIFERLQDFVVDAVCVAAPPVVATLARAAAGVVVAEAEAASCAPALAAVA